MGSFSSHILYTLNNQGLFHCSLAFFIPPKRWVGHVYSNLWVKGSRDFHLSPKKGHKHRIARQVFLWHKIFGSFLESISLSCDFSFEKILTLFTHRMPGAGMFYMHGWLIVMGNVGKIKPYMDAMGNHGLMWKMAYLKGNYSWRHPIFFTEPWFVAQHPKVIRFLSVMKSQDLPWEPRTFIFMDYIVDGRNPAPANR